MLGRLLGRGDEQKQFVLGKVAGDDHIGESGRPARDRPRLVQHYGVDFLRGLERLGRADEDAQFGTLARADHDCKRGGEAKSARARDDQNGYRANEGEGEGCWRTSHEPNHEGCNRDAHHHRHEIAGDDVCQSLDWRLRALRLFDQPDDLGQHRVLADSCGTEPKGAGLIDRGANHGVTRLLCGRYRLTSDHRLIDG